ncbi:Titin [Eumeta japonica]|uniref:Titin n=1 Tax=Eumeta variegata TaxID=151549 RepID=A0A4C1TUY5_EUMVA|nr:Titin [Eumeta japonica]
MRVEWYHNNMPLKSGSRFTETNNFGFVALDVMSCLPEDAVLILSCLQCARKCSPLAAFEETNKRQRMSAQEEIITQAPVFTLPVQVILVLQKVKRFTSKLA